MNGVSMSTMSNSGGGVQVGPAPFLSKTYEMVDDPVTDSVVSWGKTGNSFVVKKVPEFSRDLLPKYFKHNNFSSFVRQLNTYGFRKVDPDRWEFANEGFLRGQKHLLKIISRKKPTNVHNNTHQPPPQMQDKSVKSCVEVGNFGIDEEVERLKRDKNVLMQELVRLRQQQQTTDHQLHTVGQRVQVMEQRQQQMMAFLAKAMQRPGFISQLVQQHGDDNKRIKGGSKKRRLPSQDKEGSNLLSQQGVITPNGQVVKYQPLMNEAAKTMLGQIMKMNGSHRIESSAMSSGFLFNNMQSFADNSPSSPPLPKPFSISSQPYLSAELEMPVTCPSAAVCVSSPCVTPCAPIAAHYPALNVTPQQDTFVPGMSPVQGLPLENPPLDFQASEIGNIGLTGLVPGLINEPTPLITDDFPSDPQVDNVLDEVPKLPGINDIFWEQFLSVAPLVGDSDEIDSESLESCISTELDWQKGQENVWENIQNMTHLTEQMGLL